LVGLRAGERAVLRVREVERCRSKGEPKWEFIFGEFAIVGKSQSLQRQRMNVGILWAANKSKVGGAMQSTSSGSQSANASASVGETEEQRREREYREATAIARIACEVREYREEQEQRKAVKKAWLELERTRGHEPTRGHEARDHEPEPTDGHEPTHGPSRPTATTDGGGVVPAEEAPAGAFIGDDGDDANAQRESEAYWEMRTEPSALAWRDPNTGYSWVQVPGEDEIIWLNNPGPWKWYRDPDTLQCYLFHPGTTAWFWVILS